MPPPDPQWLDIFNGLAKYIGVPGAMFLAFMWVFRRILLPKVNGALAAAQKAQAEAHYEALRDHLTASFKELLHRYDMAQTEGFTQLQRDLTTTIQRETENAMTKALFNMWQTRDRK